MSKKPQGTGQGITLSPTEMIPILRWCIRTGKPHLKVGRPGVGKSDMDKQAAELEGIKILITHPVTHDSTDYSGLPMLIPNGDKRVERLPIGILRDVIETEEPLYVVFEDMGQASTMTQAAVMQLLLERSLDGKAISPQVVFGINTNRREDRAGVVGILEVIKSRCLGGIYTVEPDLNSWCKWASEDGQPPWLIALVRYRPDLITEWSPTSDISNSPCPRTIAACGDAVKDGLKERLWFQVFSGIMGQGAAAEAVRFHKIYKELPEMDRIIVDPEKAKIPHEIETQHVIVAAMANRTTEKNFGKIIQYFDRWYVGNNFPDDIPRAEMVLAYMKDAVNRHTELQATEEWVKWITDHTEVYV